MRDCCRAYADALKVIDQLSERYPDEQKTLEEMREFIQGEWDRHVDQSAEASWAD